MSKKELFTARGRLLIEVMDKPGITVSSLAGDLYLTKRTVWGIIGDLRSMGYLRVKPYGRVHHYFITSNALAELRRLVADKGAGW